MAKVPTPNQKYVLLEPMGSGIWARWEHETFTLQQVQLMLDACQIDSTWKLDKLGAHSAKPLRGYPELNLDYDAAIVVHHEDFKTTKVQNLVAEMTQKLEARGLTYRIVQRAAPETINSDLPPPGDDFQPDASLTYLTDAETVICLPSQRVLDCEEFLIPIRQFCCGKGERKPLIVKPLDKSPLPQEIDDVSNPVDFPGPLGPTYFKVRKGLEGPLPTPLRKRLLMVLTISAIVGVLAFIIYKFSTDNPNPPTVKPPVVPPVQPPVKPPVKPPPKPPIFPRYLDLEEVADFFTIPILPPNKSTPEAARRIHQVQHTTSFEAVAKKKGVSAADLGVIYLGFKSSSAMTFESGSKKGGDRGPGDVAFFYWEDLNFETDVKKMTLLPGLADLSSKASSRFAQEYWPPFERATNGEIPNFQTLKTIYIVGDLPRLVFGKNRTGSCELQDQGFLEAGVNKLRPYMTPGQGPDDVKSVAIGYLTALSRDLRKWSKATKVVYDQDIEQLYFQQLQSLK